MARRSARIIASTALFADSARRIARPELRIATKRDLLELRTELRTHFDAVAETFRAEFKNLFDGVHYTTSTLGERVDAIEKNHGDRLTAMENRVTRIEKRRDP